MNLHKLKHSINNILKNKTLLIVFFLFFLIITLIKVYASSPYQVTISNTDAKYFPKVQTNLKIQENGAQPNPTLLARNISVKENGKNLNSAMVLLKPDTFNEKIDLSILLDTSDNAKDYEFLIKSNLESFVKYLEYKNIDLNINFLNFSGDGDVSSLNLKKYSVFKDFYKDLRALSFSNTKVSRAFVLEKILSLRGQESRSGADKILLLINASQFADKSRGDNRAVYNLEDVIEELTDFKVFILGTPIKQVHEVKIDEYHGLSHLVNGGYLGNFSSDLKSIYDLLSRQNTSDYVLQYFSEQNQPTNATLYIEGYSTANISYPATTVSKPDYFVSKNEASLGLDYPVIVNIDPKGQMIDSIEVSYLTESGLKTTFLQEDRSKSTNDSLYYTYYIDKKNIVGETLSFFITVHTPFYTIGGKDDIVTVEVSQYDNGIILKSMPKNSGKEVEWSWTGPTVDEGDNFKVIRGDQEIYIGTDKKYTISTGECDKYQKIQVKVHLKANASHERAGNWSLPSRPGEEYIGETGTPKEEEAIEKLMNCMNNKTINSEPVFIQYASEYTATLSMRLDRLIFYFLNILDPNYIGGLRRDKYPLLFKIMRIIDNEDIDTAKSQGYFTTWEVIYKLIEAENYIINFKELYKYGNDQLANINNGAIDI